VTDPLIVSWPAGVDAGSAGAVRQQFAHVTDLLPTILDACGVAAPTTIRGVPQTPVHGVSFASTFTDGSAPAVRETQYFEMFGSRSIYHEGWKANCPFPGPSLSEAAEKGWYLGMRLTAEVLAELDESGWELYRLDDDPTETRNLAGDEPEKLAEMIDRWYAEAERYGVFPIVGAGQYRFREPRPTVAAPSDRQVWYPDASPVDFGAAPRLYNRAYSITADVVIPEGGAEGVIVTQGSRHGGYVVMVSEGRFRWLLNYVGRDRFEVASGVLSPGAHELRFEFDPTAKPDFRSGRGPAGRAVVYVDGALAGATEVPYTTPTRFGPVGFSCGYAAFDSVAPDIYTAPYRFTGTIERVTFDLSGELTTYDAAEFQRLMIEQ
jgi:arylsulfatase